MSRRIDNRPGHVTFLTLALALTLVLGISGCAFTQSHYAEECKTRAYIGMSIPEYLNTRFGSKSPVRMAVVPYSVPANLSYRNTEQPGLGYEIAWRVQSELLPTGQVPIVEVFNRPDWPGKKDEFFTGNYGALQLARDAGYDLVLVGYMEPMYTLDTMTVHTKVIEVESGITVFYGKAFVATYRPELERVRASAWLTDHTPSQLFIPEITNAIGRCIVHGIKRGEDE